MLLLIVFSNSFLQLSAGSSSPDLSDKLRYPVFVRTVPSDTDQTKALAKLMAKNRWDWIGVIYSDDDYGKAAFKSFLNYAESNGICLAYREVLYHYSDHKDTMQRVKKIALQIRSSKAQVVLLILKAELVELIFKEMIKSNTSRIWIASDAWSRSRSLDHLEGINTIGDILGFSFVAKKSESFDNYLKNLKTTPGGHNHFIDEYKNLRFNCSEECFSSNPPHYCPTPDHLAMKSDQACSITDPQNQNDDFLTKALDTSETFTDRLSVWATANALKTLLKCNSTSCSGEIDFQPWKVRIIKNKNTFQKKRKVQHMCKVFFLPCL